MYAETAESQANTSELLWAMERVENGVLEQGVFCQARNDTDPVLVTQNGMYRFASVNKKTDLK
ncbi:hypothetical protein N9L06_01435 [Mariniblastus sp.]|nr:hypothetical protein [Mariniblastus sp.]